VNDQRYHLTLSSAGRAMMQGWWENEEIARGMLPAWVGNWGELPDARVTLVDEESGETLTSWPQTPQASAILAP
jgi:hypothetical protein